MKKAILSAAVLVAAHAPLGGLYGAAFAAEAKKSEDIATAAVGVTMTDDVVAENYIGESIYSSDGRRLGAVYSEASNGAAQVMIGQRPYFIPASTLSIEDGKLTTSWTRKDVMTSR